MYYKGDTDIYEMIDTPTSLGRLGFVLLMVFLTSSPFLLFNKKSDIGFRALVSLSMVDPLDSQKTAKFFFDNLNIISQEKLGDFFGEPDD